MRGIYIIILLLIQSISFGQFVHQYPSGGGECSQESSCWYNSEYNVNIVRQIQCGEPVYMRTDNVSIAYTSNDVDLTVYNALYNSIEPNINIAIETSVGTITRLDCAEVLGGCGQKAAIGQPDVVGTPLLWVNPDEKGTMFDDSGDPVPATLSQGTGPGYNFGLSAFSGAFSGNIRTAFDISGNDFHLMEPLGALGLSYSNVATGLEPWQSEAYIEKVSTAAGTTKLLHKLTTPLSSQPFQIDMVFEIPTMPNEHDSFFASTSRQEGGVGPSGKGTSQLGRGAVGATRVMPNGSRIKKSHNYLVFRIVSYTSNKSGDYVISTISSVVGLKTHVRLSYDGANLTIYKNGVFVAKHNIGRIDLEHLAIFSNRTGTAGIAGKLYEFIMFENPLDDVANGRLADYILCKHQIQL